MECRLDLAVYEVGSSKYSSDQALKLNVLVTYP